MAKTRDGSGGSKAGVMISSTVSFIFLVIMAVKLFKSTPNDCELLLQTRILPVMIFLAIISTIICCCGGFCPRLFCVVCLFSVASLIVFLCFVFINLSLVRKGGGEVLPGIGYKEYRLTSYGHKLQQRVSNPKKWKRIDKCLHHNDVCKKMMSPKWTNLTLQEFHSKRLSSIESGCCKPSNDCNLTYVSPTNWTKNVTNSSNYTNQDCNEWDNDPKILCFSCSSCKAGVVDKYKHHWFTGVWSSIK